MFASSTTHVCRQSYVNNFDHFCIEWPFRLMTGRCLCKMRPRGIGMHLGLINKISRSSHQSRVYKKLLRNTLQVWLHWNLPLIYKQLVQIETSSYENIFISYRVLRFSRLVHIGNEIIFSDLDRAPIFFILATQDLSLFTGRLDTADRKELKPLLCLKKQISDSDVKK